MHANQLEPCAHINTTLCRWTCGIILTAGFMVVIERHRSLSANELRPGRRPSLTLTQPTRQSASSHCAASFEGAGPALGALCSHWHGSNFSSESSSSGKTTLLPSMFSTNFLNKAHHHRHVIARSQTENKALVHGIGFVQPSEKLRELKIK